MHNNNTHCCHDNAHDNFVATHPRTVIQYTMKCKTITKFTVYLNLTL